MHKYNLSKNIKTYSFARLLLAFILGIIFPNDIIDVSVYLCILSLLIILMLFYKFINMRIGRLINLFGLLIVVFVFFLASCLSSYNSSKLHFNNANKQIVAEAIYYGNINKYINSQNSKIRITKYRINNHWYHTSVNVMATMPKHSMLDNLEIGQHILVNTKLIRIDTNSNSLAFNYPLFLKRKNIIYKCYINPNNTILIKTRSLRLINWANGIKNHLVNIIDKANIRGDTKHVLLALGIGYKAHLSPMLKKQWVNAGAIHVLAVSGMHVGVICLIFSFLLRFMDGDKYLFFLKSILLLLILFCYVVITGFSPSVCRASVMFAFIIIGKTINRKSKIYNSLCLSALFMMIINTNIIYNVGFQLSYIAVFSIVYLYPKLHNILKLRNVILNNIWQFCCVSIAAQIGSLPISMYYFHQVPNYSIISNFVVIPLAVLFIYACVSLLIFSFHLPTILLIGTCLERVFYIANNILKYITSLPGSTVKNIFINEYQLLILYLIIISLVSLFLFRKRNNLHIIISLCLIFNIINAYKYFQIPVYEVLVFKNRNKNIISLKSGTNLLVIHDFNLSEKTIKKQIDYYASKSNVSNIKYATLQKNIVYSSNNKSVAYTQGNINMPENSNKLFFVNLFILNNSSNLSSFSNMLNADKYLLMNKIKSNRDVSYIYRKNNRGEFSFIKDNFAYSKFQ